MAGDPLWYYKVLGLHCDGTNGSTTFTDVKGKTVTVAGNAQISTAQYPALTGKSSSGYLDGTGDYLQLANTSDFDFGSGDFLVRMRFRPASLTGNRVIIHRGQATGYSPWTIYTIGANLYAEGSTTGSSWAYTLTGATTLSVDTWYVVELYRVGTEVGIRVNGSRDAYTSVSGSLMVSTATPRIGANSAGTNAYVGYISEVEIYKGVAPNPTNYTPSSDPFLDEYVSISGTTKDENDAFASRLVRVYRSDSGELVGSAVSDNSTGAYKIIAQNSGTTTPLNHYAVCHPNSIPYAANVVLAMPFDPEYTALTTFKDLKGHVFTRNGSATLSATKAKHGVYSFYNGATTSDYIYTPPSTDFDFTSTTEFTVEFWMNTTLYDVAYTRGVVATFGFVDTAGTGFSIGYYTGNIHTHLGVDTLRIDDGLWHHISMSVDSTTTRVFIDGNLRQSGARAANTYNAARNLVIGNFANLDVARVFVGYIDGLVIWKGAALRTAAFTPPARFLVDAPPPENALILDDITPV